MPIDIKKFRSQVRAYSQVRDKFVAYADTLQQVLSSATLQLCPLAIVQTRAKAVPSFAGKLSLKWGKYRDPVGQMTDLCGGRVICSLREEADRIIQFIRDHFEIDEENSLDVASRLLPTQFGYRSVHYIVQFRKRVFPNDMIKVEIPEDVYGLRAEIQVRTMAQHAWSDVGHDRLYKSTFKVPAVYERESARIAALLEKADDSFSQLVDGIETLKANAAAYMTSDEVRAEIARLAAVRKCDPKNAELLDRMAQLMIAEEQWSDLIALLEDVPKSRALRGSARLISHLGFGYCEQNRDRPQGQGYRNGLELQAQAAQLDPNDVDILTRLGECWTLIAPRPGQTQSLQWFGRAYQVDPSHPRALLGYLRHTIAANRDFSVVSVVLPSIEAAVGKCRAQINVDLNLPAALYHLAELQLLLHRPYDSLAAYTLAVALSVGTALIDQALAALEMLRPVASAIPEIEWVERFLLLAKASKGDASAMNRIHEMATPEVIKGPVVIVAGGCDPVLARQMGAYRALLQTAFQDFRGTIISGGTKQGIAGQVGYLTKKSRGRIQSIGHLPCYLPADGTATRDERYTELRPPHTKSLETGFCALQPLRYWADLLHSGIKPSQVKLLGINGGTIAAFEFRLAAALGASVGVVQHSGREADRLALQDEWRRSARLVLLPNDPMTLNAFIHVGGTSLLTGADRETLAELFHGRYREEKAPEMIKTFSALADWNELRADFKESNRQQADHVGHKLAAVEMKAVRVPESARPALIEFTNDQIERLAEMEHGRWVVERLLAGWTCGPRDDSEKRHENLVPWGELADNVKRLDRLAVKQIPEMLADIGYEIVPTRGK